MESLTHTKRELFKLVAHIDWWLILALFPIMIAGLVTMHAFVGDNSFYDKQIIWIAISLVVFVFASLVDFRFLRKSEVTFGIYMAAVLLLTLLFVFATVTNGARSWFDFGFFSFEPADLAKLALIVVLAKYFSRRHIEIAHIRHILVSGVYALVLVFLVFLQPDFGSAAILGSIWFGMVLVSGISKKHLFLVFLGTLAVGSVLWFFVFAPYQKDRILTFLNPLTDIHGSGYNAYQSTVAVGSGQLLGKGVGYGTQSRLEFLPEYQTDFIFAAFSEEWGFIGAVLIFLLFLFVIYRIIRIAFLGASNFEVFFGLGIAILFLSHFFVNVGMNIGLLPITGITLPFMSYGGSHLLVSFLGLGMLMGMRRYGRPARIEETRNEFLGF